MIKGEKCRAECKNGTVCFNLAKKFGRCHIHQDKKLQFHIIVCSNCGRIAYNKGVKPGEKIDYAEKRRLFRSEVQDLIRAGVIEDFEETIVCDDCIEVEK